MTGGRTVTLAAPPQRVVSLLPSLSETVCELGQCHRLVGVDRYSNFPAALQKLPQLGGGLDPNIEAVVAVRPDVVLVAASSRAAERLEALGLKVVVLEPKTHADVQRVLRKVAQALGQPVADADRVWRHIDAAVSAAAQSLPASAKGARVYFEVNRAPYGAGTTSFIGETLTRLGVRNILGPELGPFPKLNPEFVVRANPDVIMVGARNFSGMADRPGWKGMKAIAQNRLCVFSLDESDMLVRPGPRMAEAARLMAECIAAKTNPKAPSREDCRHHIACRGARPDTGARRAWWLALALVLLGGGLALVSLAVGSTGVEPIFQVLEQLLNAPWGGVDHSAASAGRAMSSQASAQLSAQISAQIVWDIRCPAPWGVFGRGLAGSGRGGGARAVSQPAGRSVFAGQCLGGHAGCGQCACRCWACQPHGYQLGGAPGAHGRCLRGCGAGGAADLAAGAKACNTRCACCWPAWWWAWCWGRSVRWSRCCRPTSCRPCRASCWAPPALWAGVAWASWLVCGCRVWPWRWRWRGCWTG
jgi:iron complex transport system substrate-binding protein